MHSDSNDDDNALVSAGFPFCSLFAYIAPSAKEEDGIFAAFLNIALDRLHLYHVRQNSLQMIAMLDFIMGSTALALERLRRGLVSSLAFVAAFSYIYCHRAQGLFGS
jgi:hypothetical protein